MRVLSLSVSPALGVATLLRFAVAMVFLAAAFFKSVDPTAPAEAVFFLFGGSLSPGGAVALVALVAGVEAATAFALLAWPRSSRPLAAVLTLLAAFLLVQGYLAVTPGAPGCGCFGEGDRHASGLSPHTAGIGRNLGLAAVVVALWPACAMQREGDA